MKTKNQESKEPKIESSENTEKELETENEVKGEGKPLEIREETLPWEGEGEETQKALSKFYQEDLNLNEETKEGLDHFLGQEIDKEKIEFAKKWFQDHRTDLEDQYGKVIKKKNLSESFIYNIVNEHEGFKDLKEKKTYQEQNEKIQNVQALKYDLKRAKYLPIDSRFIILNRLQKKTEELEKELTKGGSDEDQSTIQFQLGELSKFKRELVEKTTGENLEKTDEQKVKPLTEKSEYIKNNLEDGLKDIDDKAKKNTLDPEKLRDAETQAYLEYLHYTSKTKGLFKKKIEISDENGKNLGSFKKQGGKLRLILRNKLEEVIQEDLGNQWENLNNNRKQEIQEKIKEEIKQFAKSPEKAEGGIEGVYKRLKERLINEFIEKDLKNNPKSKAEMGKLEKELGEKGSGKKISELMHESLHRKGEFQNLTGDGEQDAEKLSKIAENFCGINAPRETIVKIEKAMAKKGKSYEKAAGLREGFAFWVIEFLIELTLSLAKEAKSELDKEQDKKDKRGNKK